MTPTHDPAALAREALQDKLLNPCAITQAHQYRRMKGREPILAREVLRLRGLIEWHESASGHVRIHHGGEDCRHIYCMMARGESAPGEER